MSYIKRMEIRGFKKFDKLEFEFNKDVNVIVGGNESGKSTVLEALNLVLNQTYRNFDKYIIKDMLNVTQITKFQNNPKVEELPAVSIEVRFVLDACNYSSDFFGENNFKGSGDGDFGILFECKFDAESFGDMLKSEIENGIIPYEYYSMQWKTFQGGSYKVQKKPLNSILIDTSTSNANNSFNYFNKALFNSKYDEAEKMRAKNLFRKEVDNVFTKINLDSIDEKREFRVNSKKVVFESIISVYENDIPLENKGSGMENLIKTEIALDKRKNLLDVVMIEEPENHLCHSNLLKMLSAIENELGESQLIITTHSNMIASRLNLKNVHWICENSVKSLNKIEKDTADFFTKADNNKFLEVLLAKKVILVEGPTEFLLLPKFYSKFTNRKIDEDNISVISCDGLSYKRYLAITNATDKKVAVITDNDGKQSNIDEMQKYKNDIKQRIFMDYDLKNWTWEVCIHKENEQYCTKNIEVQKVSKYLFNGNDYGQVLGKMLNNKVDVAFKMLIDEDNDLNIPEYVKDAFEWINK